MRIYLPGETIEPGRFPSILAIGDSWCWYPGNNLLQAIALHPKTLDPYKNMQIIGYNGAKLAEYVTYNGKKGRYAAEIARQLKPINAQYYSAVVISGAGNDAVDFGLALEKECKGITDAGACLRAAGIAKLQEQVGDCLEILLKQVAKAFAGRMVQVFLHGYDYPVPDGRGFTMLGLKITGPWLLPALKKAHVAESIRFEVCRELMKRLNTTISAFADTANGIYFIDSCGALDSSPAGYQADWANEMHPTVSGFNKLVNSKWLAALQAAGIASN